MAQTNLVKEVAIKQNDGTLGSYYKIGGSFSEIVDTRTGKGNYSLAQFFDNYLNFMKNTTFVYAGVDKPANTHIGLWLDTGHSNQDNL